MSDKLDRLKRAEEEYLEAIQELMEISDKHSRKVTGRLISISDDDLCATCKHCIYNPGELSGCHKEWPGKFDDDGYMVMCKTYEEKTDEQD